MIYKLGVRAIFFKQGCYNFYIVIPAKAGTQIIKNLPRFAGTKQKAY
jgi:hypothetical protein